jgi:hypothetical protein
MDSSAITEVGMLPAIVPVLWPTVTSTTLIITGRQLAHILDAHPEMSALFYEILMTLRDPDEIHRDRISLTSAILWRALDQDGEHWVRASVSLATPDKGAGRSNSLITAWRIRRRGYLGDVHAGRRAWRKGES